MYESKKIIEGAISLLVVNDLIKYNKIHNLYIRKIDEECVYCHSIFFLKLYKINKKNIDWNPNLGYSTILIEPVEDGDK